MSEPNTILVRTADPIGRRGPGSQPLEVKVLADNVNLFLNQVGGVLDKAPETVGKFKLAKFVVSAEVSTEGKLVLLGSGLEAAAKGGLTFEFERNV